MSSFIKKFNSLLKRNKVLILMAFLIGLIYVFPYLFLMYDLGDNYNGINIFKSSDEENYLAIAREIQDGHLGYPSPYIWENRNDGAGSEMIQYGPKLVGLIAKFFNINVPILFLLFKFIGPIILFIFFYILTYLISNNRNTSLFSSLVFTLGMGLIGASLFDQIKTIFWQENYTQFIRNGRMINPLFTFLFFIPNLIFIYLLFKDKRWKWSFWAGIFLGINFYMYLYFWSFSLSLMVILIIYSLFIRDKKFFLKILSSVLIGIVLGMGSIFIIYKIIIGSSIYSNSEVIKIAVHTHKPIIEKVIWVGFFMYLIFLAINNKIKDKNCLFIFFLFFSAFVVVNQQIITGMEVQPHHYYWTTNIPVLFLSLSVMLFFYLNKIKNHKIKNILTIFLFIYIFLFGIGVQTGTYNYWRDTVAKYQDYAPALHWIDVDDMGDESVILSNNEISELVPIYTNNYVYYAPHASVYPVVTTERKKHNYFIYSYINGFTSDNVREVFYKKRNEIGVLIFEGQYYKNICGSYGCFPDEILEGLIEEYKIFLKDPFEDQLKKYKVDYFIWDKEEDSNWDLDKFEFLEKIWQKENVIIYKVN